MLSLNSSRRRSCGKALGGRPVEPNLESRNARPLPACLSNAWPSMFAQRSNYISTTAHASISLRRTVAIAVFNMSRGAPSLSPISHAKRWHIEQADMCMKQTCDQAGWPRTGEQVEQRAAKAVQVARRLRRAAELLCAHARTADGV